MASLGGGFPNRQVAPKTEPQRAANAWPVVFAEVNPPKRRWRKVAEISEAKGARIIEILAYLADGEVESLTVEAIGGLKDDAALHVQERERGIFRVRYQRIGDQGLFFCGMEKALKKYREV